MRMMVTLCLGAFFSTIAPAVPRAYEVYPVDGGPFEENADLGKEWAEIQVQWKEKIAPESVLRRQIQIVETLVIRQAGWIDGYWMAANANFQYGSTLSDPRDLPKARALFLRGKKHAEICLQMQAENPLCKFFFAVNLGKMSSIDGIFASLKNASIIEKMWADVLKSRYNHQFSERSSLQGAARYALGMFYRLVPDLLPVAWLFGTKGDIRKSVSYHRESLKYDPPNICTRTMFAVALICEGKSDFKSDSGQAGLGQLREAKALTPTSTLLASCAKDLPALEKDPSLACGYETSRQQTPTEASAAP